MALRIVELFGHAPPDATETAATERRGLHCPFVQSECTKLLRDGTRSGVCTVRQTTSGPVICCPNRMYDENYRILSDVCEVAFGAGTRLIPAKDVANVQHQGRYVAVFGKGWGKELRLPRRGGRGGYFVDWVLALIGTDGRLEDFVAVEVQTIDTTGNYRAERDAYMAGRNFDGQSPAGLNWENVSKRILPQLIYKGYVLRRERLCRSGLFFVCPTPVYERIMQRLGGRLREYPLQTGSVTFRWYDVGPDVDAGQRRRLNLGGQFITAIDEVAAAFNPLADLPPSGVYEEAIRTELEAGARGDG